VRRPRTSCACWGVTQSSAVRAAALKRAPTNTTYRLPPTVPPTSAHTSARHAAHRRTPRGQRCAASTCSRLYLARVLRVGARHASPRGHINLMKLSKREIHIVLYRSRAIVVATGYEIHVPRPSRIVPVCRRSSPVGHTCVTYESHSVTDFAPTRSLWAPPLPVGCPAMSCPEAEPCAPSPSTTRSRAVNWANVVASSRKNVDWAFTSTSSDSSVGSTTGSSPSGMVTHGHTDENITLGW